MQHNDSARKHLFQTNVLGTLNVCRLSVPLMARNEEDTKQWRGVIVNTAGVEGNRGSMGQVAISAASRAIIGNILIVPLCYLARFIINKMYFFEYSLGNSYDGTTCKRPS